MINMMNTNNSTKSRSLISELKFHGVILFGFVALIWAIEIIDLVIFQGSLDALGIKPRSPEGLVGILLAPFLHGGFGHVASNTVPFLIFGWLIMLRETWHFFAVTAISAILGGLGVWLIAPSASVHIGASGVIFGLFGFLLLAGWFERKLGTIILSIVILLTYGGLIFGVLPGQLGISWQGHLFGFLAGVLSAKLLARKKKTEK